jgi:DNA-binding protein HU-beta
MTKQELIERIYRQKDMPAELTKKAVAQVLDAAFSELGEYFVRAKVGKTVAPRFTYPGFGTFTKRRRGERVGRNPQTGEKLTIPPSTTVAFAPGVELRGQLNKK